MKNIKLLIGAILVCGVAVISSISTDVLRTETVANTYAEAGPYVYREHLCPYPKKGIMCIKSSAPYLPECKVQGPMITCTEKK